MRLKVKHFLTPCCQPFRRHTRRVANYLCLVSSAIGLEQCVIVMQTQVYQMNDLHTRRLDTAPRCFIFMIIMFLAVLL